MTQSPIFSHNLQSLYASMSNNIIDFNECLNNTFLLSKKLERYVQKTLSQLNLPNLKIPSAYPEENVISPELSIPKLRCQSSNANHKAASQKANTEKTTLRTNEESSILVKRNYEELVPTSNSHALPRQRETLKSTQSLETGVKLEDQHPVPAKKLKIQTTSYEGDSDSTSDSSPKRTDFKLKLEESIPVPQEASIKTGDKPVNIKGLKVDKSSKQTYYLVEWTQRQNGLKPSDSFIAREEILQQHGHLIATFFESQLMKRVAC